MSKGGPTYLSYLLRLWQVSDDDRPVWRASLQSAETGERVGFAGLEELFDYLRQQVGVTVDKMDKDQRALGKSVGEDGEGKLGGGW